MNLSLSDGDRVCIVGGGPAGSFTALHLLRLARFHGLSLEVTIFEPRDFSMPGPGGCNRCAGILSTRLLDGLERLELELPREVVQAPIRSYAIHIDGDTIPIHQPDPRRRIVSVYRGGGPRLLQSEPLAGFDGFLLNAATERGARHLRGRVLRIAQEDRPVVHLARERFHADLLVLATGVNSRAPLEPSFGYRAPPTAIMAQDEVLRPPGWPDDQVKAFFRRPRGLLFGALTPKGQYVNISLMGRNLKTDAVSDFLEAQSLSESLPLPQGSLCGCTPRIAVGKARGFYGDRWVAVGDAAVTRLYKDGIGSAFATAERAMQTAFTHGIGKRAWRAGYAPACRRIASDNAYGRMLFGLWDLTVGSPRLLQLWKRAVRLEEREAIERRVHMRVLWGMFTGDEPYRDLMRLSIGPAGLRGFFRALAAPARGAMAQ